MVVWLIGAAAIGGLIHDSRHLEVHSQEVFNHSPRRNAKVLISTFLEGFIVKLIYFILCPKLKLLVLEAINCKTCHLFLKRLFAACKMFFC